MDSPSPPATPDPFKTAAAQGQANIDAARVTTALNRPEQITPFGSVSWTQGAATPTFNQDRYDKAYATALRAYNQEAASRNTSTDGEDGLGGFGMFNRFGGRGQVAPVPGFVAPDRNAAEFFDQVPSDKWTSTVTLDPRVQNIVDASLAGGQQVLGEPFPEADAETRQRVEDALYGRMKSRLDPQFQQDEAMMRSNLMNRGIVEGSEAWNTELDNFNRRKNDAYSSASQDAIYKGGDEMARLLEMALGRRAGMTNELNAIRSGSQVGMPNFSPMSGANVMPAPLAQSVYNSYQGQMGQYNADVASNNSTIGTVGALGSTAMMGMMAMGMF